MHNWVKLLISLIVPQLVAASGAYFTVAGVGSWYQQIRRPLWNPPNWVFGPVWTILYLMMGVSFYLVWKSSATAKVKRAATIFWILQLILNFLWFFLFFGQHEIAWAAVEIFVLWLAVIATIFSFSRVSKTAAWLLVPYLSWVSFAALLAFTIWRLNE